MVTGKRTPMSDEAKARLRQERVAAAQEAVERLGEESSWSGWLKARAGLHRFSISNQILLAEQCRERGIEPSLIQSATSWKRAGFHPAAGSKALYVWAFRSRRKKTVNAWTCCGSTVVKSVCPSCGRPDHYFTLAPEFAASQVVSFETGEPPAAPPPLAPIVGASMRGQGEHLAEWLMDEKKLEVLFLSSDADPELQGGARGYFSMAKQRIVIRADLTDSHNQQFATLVHEAVHALGVTSRNKDMVIDYATAEVLTECTAFVVCQAVGLDTSHVAVPYMTQWATLKPEVIQQYATIINDTARVLESVLIPEE